MSSLLSACRPPSLRRILSPTAWLWKVRGPRQNRLHLCSIVGEKPAEQKQWRHQDVSRKHINSMTVSWCTQRTWFNLLKLGHVAPYLPPEGQITLFDKFSAYLHLSPNDNNQTSSGFTSNLQTCKQLILKLAKPPEVSLSEVVQNVFDPVGVFLTFTVPGHRHFPMKWWGNGSLKNALLVFLLTIPVVMSINLKVLEAPNRPHSCCLSGQNLFSKEKRLVFNRLLSGDVCLALVPISPGLSDITYSMYFPLTCSFTVKCSVSIFLPAAHFTALWLNRCLKYPSVKLLSSVLQPITEVLLLCVTC